ncbi:MAG: tetratricopeptide repeat protein [Candidatus Eisenbacteria bacterium]|uniref:Tetratricopeptide repeat protein n=1 Tax=Eiseniibacteriota bacterium TaxID=2212470 RepID=A0A538THJ5_UNCEI|nr:MAG: tetratricopeptide repeat protein [Candidatus Eisenbacteria bacterium]
MRRIRIASLAVLLLGVCGAWRAAGAATQPPPQEKEKEKEATDVYRAIVRAAEVRSPSDTLGNGVYTAAKEAFYAGKFDEAIAHAGEFTKAYLRNLNMNDALELVLLMRGFRDFQDEPLRGYAKVLALREGGRPDSASAVAARTLERWPGASIRYHLHYQMAELARDRGDHAAAVTHAMAVADSSSKSRLAPAALKLAGDETIALGEGRDRALKLYQELLERFPDSPLAPGVRSQVIEMRKGMQL